MTRRILLCAVLLAACDSPTAPALRNLKISSVSQLEVGETIALKATGENGDGAFVPAEGVQWRVSDNSIATVGSDGSLTGVKAGTVTLMARVGSAFDIISFAVVPPAARSLSFQIHTISLVGGDTRDVAIVALDARGQPASTPGMTVTTSDGRVAGATTNPFRVNAHFGGRTIIRVTLGTLTDSLIVDVTERSVGRLDMPPTTTLSVDQSTALDVGVFGTTGAPQDNTMTWTTDDPTIISLSSPTALQPERQINLHALREGVAHVTVRAGGASSTIEVRATPASNRGWKQVAIGEFFACALNEDGQAYCGGLDNAGQLGDGRPFATVVPNGSNPALAFAPVSGAWRYTAISAGKAGVCGVTAEHIAVCWGSGSQMSDATVNISLPHVIDPSLHFEKVENMDYGACGLTVEKEIYCWNDAFGTTQTVAPFRVATSGAVTDMSSDQFALCYTTEVARTDCIGIRGIGVSSVISTDIAFQSVTVGELNHACGVSDGAPYCWDNGTSSPAKMDLPAALTGRVAIGDRNACGVVVGGSAYCWQGAELRQQSGTASYRSIAAGFLDVCAISTTDDLYCWNASMTRPERPMSATLPPVLIPREPTR